MSLVRRARSAPVAYATSRALGSGMGQLIRHAARSYKRRRTGAPAKSESAFASAAPLTGQFDYKTDYRKRRVSRRRRRVFKRRRKWRRKVVNTVRNANVGTTHVLRRDAAVLNSGANLTDACSFGLYGQNGTTNTGSVATAGGLNTCCDVRELFREISSVDWDNALSNDTVAKHHKIYSMHATMEMTLRNRGTNDAIVEAYFIRGTRPTFSGTDANPTNIYAQAFNKMNTAVDPNTGNTFDPLTNGFKEVGITPFQAPWFCRHFKIYKRTKFRIPPGNEVSFVIHDRRPRVFVTATARTRATDKSYHGVLFQQFGSPSLGGGAETLALPTSIDYLSVRRYRIKLMRDNLPMVTLDVPGS